MKILRYLMTAAMLLGFAAWLRSAHAAIWTGTTGTDWFDADNWNPAVVPGEAAAVSIPAGTTILLTNETAALASFTMAGGTLTFSNWTTRLQSDTVAINGGTLTLPPAFSEAQMSNRVWIVCGDFTLADGAMIDADGKGYVVEQGEGKGNSRGGAGHGGVGGLGSSTAWAAIGKVYGSAAVPMAPGSGGGAAVTLGSGGGAVWIDAEGAVTIHGEILVRGNNTTGLGGGGSGGSILIECLTFHGSATGLLNASGGDGGFTGIGGGGGSGGRIAVIYDPSAQSALTEPNPLVRFWCGPGTGGAIMSLTARPGTLCLPDTAFLSTDMTAARWDNVTLVIPGFSVWSLPALTLGGKIGFKDVRTIAVAGDLNLLSGGRLTLYGSPSHPEVPGAGMVLDVGGKLTIENLAELELFADPLSGVAPYVECGRLHVQAGGRISGDWHGFAQATGDGAGTGRGGAGYGGEGSPGTGTTPGPTYGRIHAPVKPGSGGGPATDGGGKGGGLVRVSACGAMQVDGTVTASGMIRITTGSCGGGSGGGILLSAGTFAGATTGLLRANGGDSTLSTGGAGGGGRISVWTPFLSYAQLNDLADEANPPTAAETVTPSDVPGFDGTASAPWSGFSGTVNVAPGTGGGNPELAKPGTVFFGKLMFGTLLMIH